MDFHRLLYFCLWFYRRCAVDIGVVCAAENIVDAHAVKLGKAYERLCRRYTLAILKLGQQRLLYPRFHLQTNLRIALAFA